MACAPWWDDADEEALVELRVLALRSDHQQWHSVIEFRLYSWWHSADPRRALEKGGISRCYSATLQSFHGQFMDADGGIWDRIIE